MTAADIACLRIAGMDPSRISTIAKTLLPLAQNGGVAVLLDDADLAVKLRADGVHLPDAGRYRDARRILGTDGIVGVACPLERHTAMEVGEAGADYVQFTATVDSQADALELAVWWTEMMTVPSVIAGEFAADAAAQFVATGADFLAPDPRIWSASDPIKAIAALLAQ
jgi:thiamine-phosphate pyrophosphorylase